jgi:putative tricarboxylic transport membrane protein
VDSLQALMHGFTIAMQPQNLLFAIIGCFIGTLIGVLPGIGPAAGTAILIPVTFALEPTPAIIMLSSIFYGAMYGGTITSVLVNVPGEATSAITCLDGYQMAKQGRAGPALAVAAIGSFIGGTVATMGLVLLATPLTEVAVKFGAPEFFGLMLLGLTTVVGLAGRSLVRALVAAVIGLLVASVGIDPIMGAQRFTFGHMELMDGFGLVPVAVGLFGVGEILVNAEAQVQEVFSYGGFRSLIMSKKDWRDSAWPITRGTFIGFFMGLIPGVGAIVPTFISYVVEKKMSKYPEKFGTGVIEGVAAPETCNNAYANAALIPLFTLGIPGSATVAILMGAFMMNGLIPGPLLFKDHADFVWAIIASLYIGNVILLIMNLPLIPLWVAVLRIPYAILYGLILAFCAIGAYSVDGAVFDIGAMATWGIVGYVFKKLDIPVAPIVLTLILGPLLERNLRRALEMSQGDYSIFFNRPFSAVLLAITAVIIIATTFRVGTAVKGDSEL